MKTFFNNRYSDTLHDIKFSKKIVDNDIDAYQKFKKHNYVYDKLWVAKTQGLKCGRMKEYPNNSLYPVFVKPIIALKGGNVDCFKIDTPYEYNKYKERNDLFWCEYIDEQEGSTDFIVKNGNILFELTYNIDTEQGGFLQTLTKISMKNKCPGNMINWIKTNLSDYNGIVNLQYRGNKIIECGLRFDSGGNFIQFTNNKNIIIAINKFFEDGEWIYNNNDLKYHFKDAYIYKCSCKLPIIYYIPAPVIIALMKLSNIKYYGFYIDESQDKLSFLNIVGTDDERYKLEIIKTVLERLMIIINWMFIIGFLLISFIFINYLLNNKFFRLNKKHKLQVIYGILGFILLYLTRFLNPPKYLRRII